MRSRRAAGLLAAAWLLAGCGGPPLFDPRRVSSQPEAGAIALAVTLVAPWEDYAGVLGPTFSLKPEDALAKVIPQTTVLEEKVMEALGLTAGVGLPRTFETKTATERTKGGESATEVERVAKEEPGTLPAPPGPPPGAEKGAAALTGVPSGRQDLGKDQMLAYSAATALYQEVQLLNRYVTDAALRRGMKAYVVRLQLSVVPYARFQPYDLYANIGFFTANDGPPDAQQAKRRTGDAVVVPLLVTDNLEGTLKARSTDAIRQLALALSLMQSGVLANLGLNKRIENIQSVLGTDANSLLTVGRITDNTIQVRLGAAQQATTRYAMFPRTHNITLVVMVPEEFARASAPTVRVVAKAVMRDAETGTVLPQPGREERLENVIRVLNRFTPDGVRPIGNLPGGRLTKEECASTKIQWGDPDERKLRQAADSLLRATFINSHDHFMLTLRCADWEIIFPRDLWIEIVETLQRSGFTGTNIDLPAHKEPALPDPNQSVLLLDDGAAKMVARIKGGRALIRDRMSATLTLASEDGTEVPLAAGDIAVGPGGRDPVLEFPSLAALKIRPLQLKGAQLTRAKLELRHEQDSPWNKKAGPVPISPFGNIYYQAPAAPKPVFAIRKAADFIKHDKSAGGLKLYVEFHKNEKKQALAAAIEIKVEGGEIAAVSSDAEGSLAPRLDTVTVSRDGTLDFRFRNLDTAKKVVFKATARDASNRPIGGKFEDLAIEVKPGDGKAN